MKRGRTVLRARVESFIVLAMRNKERGAEERKKERRSRIDNDDNNSINLVALDRFPCWRERGLQ